MTDNRAALCASKVAFRNGTNKFKSLSLISHTFAKDLRLACLHSFGFKDHDVSLNPKLFLPLENK
jgi:hypothetical protein